MARPDVVLDAGRRPGKRTLVTHKDKGLIGLHTAAYLTNSTGDHALKILIAPFAALLLAGCTQTTGKSVSPSPATPASAPTTTACAREIANYRAVMSNDLQMGHVAASVHAKIDSEIRTAETACAAGRDGQAVAMLNATKARHGYR
jgi:hypothetical protein